MRILSRDRASTQVLGFALMFAVVATTFSLYQADVVMYQNEKIERQHNQAMEQELEAVAATMQDAGTSRSAGRTTVTLSPSYPKRAVAVNPPQPMGRIVTTPAHPVNVSGLWTDPGRYWDGSPKSFQSRFLTHSITYNHIEGADYAIEHGMVVKQYANGATRNLTASPVNGNRISLTLLGGNYERTGHQASVEFAPVSVATRSTTVSAKRADIDGDGTKEDPRIWLPTQLSQSEWDDIAAAQDRLVAADVKESHEIPTDSPRHGHGDYVRLELQPGVEYDLRISKVTLGQPADTEAAYIVAETSELQVPAGESGPVTFTVHDRYGNPVESETVNLSVAGHGQLAETTLESDADGTVKTFFSGGGTTPGTVEARIGNGTGYEKATIDVVGSTRNELDQMSIFDGGQLFRGSKQSESLYLSDVYAQETTQEICLLTGDDNGLLGLIGDLTCATGTRNVVRSVTRVSDNGTEYRVTIEMVDADQDGWLTHDGSSYEGDEYAAVKMTGPLTANYSDAAFRGVLKPGPANHLYVTKTGKVDLLDTASYQTYGWDNDSVCIDDCGSFDGADVIRYELTSSYDEIDRESTSDGDGDSGHGSFDDFLNEIDRVYVVRSVGRLNLSVESD